MARVCRVAVAEGSGPACPPLGRALRFAVFDVEQGRVRGPVYRVRHDNPGESCDQHAELLALVHDCQCVIAGSVGPRLGQRLRDAGMQVLATSETGSSATLAARMEAGRLVCIDEVGTPIHPGFCLP